MYLARLTPGLDPVVTPVADDEGYLHSGKIVLRARKPWARKTRTGAAALSQTPHGAIASAKAVLEREILKQRGDGRPGRPKYQRAHIA